MTTAVDTCSARPTCCIELPLSSKSRRVRVKDFLKADGAEGVPKHAHARGGRNRWGNQEKEAISPQKRDPAFSLCKLDILCWMVSSAMHAIHRALRAGAMGV